MKKIIFSLWVVVAGVVNAQTGQTGIGTQTTSATLDVVATPMDTKVLDITNSASEPLLTVLPNGNVGVSTNPTTFLDVNGIFRVGGSTINSQIASNLRLSNSSNRGRYYTLYNSSDTGGSFSTFKNSFSLYDRTFPRIFIAPEQPSASLLFAPDPVAITPEYMNIFSLSSGTIKTFLLVGERTPFYAPKSYLEVNGSFATAIDQGITILDESHSTVNATSNITLPPVNLGSKVAGTQGRIYTIYLAQGVSSVTISTTGGTTTISDVGTTKSSVTIDNTTPGNRGIRLQSNGANWYVTGRFF